MQFKACYTCRYFFAPEREETEESVVFKAALCDHPRSAGSYAMDMVLFGDCGSRLKLWEKASDSPFEFPAETD